MSFRKKADQSSSSEEPVKTEIALRKRVGEWAKNLPWERIPKWPGFAKLFGPILLFLAVVLFASFFLILSVIRPDPPGKKLGLSEVFRAARACRIESATLLDLDSVLVLKIYDAPPSAPSLVPPSPDSAPVCSKPASDLLSEQLQAQATAEAAAAQAALAAQQSQAGGQAQASPAPPPQVPIVKLPAPKTYWAAYPSSDSETSVIAQELFNGAANWEVDHQNDKKRLKFIGQFLVPLLILAVVFSFFFLVITGRGGGAADFLGFSKFAAKIQRRKKGHGAVTFNDIGAIEEGLTELREVVDYLMNPEQFAEIGARAPKGVLLVGPPGTGKTLLARAVAGEANVPFIQLSGSEFVESLVGVGAARVRSLFQQARDLAPCIIFIDELDAAGRQRGAGVGGGNDEREQTLNQLLVEMDGFASSIGIAVLGATNRPDILDPALLRPGRFDRQVVIDVPDVRGRLDILKIHARGRPMGPDMNLESIAKQCPGFTGAELANILNEAALLAVRRKRHEILQMDLEEGLDRVIAGPERKSHLLTEDEKIMIAYHEAGHAVVATGAGQATGVLKLSVVARGLQLGHASTFSSADRLIMLRSEVEGQLTTLLGGAAAEKLVFGEVSTGNAGDLEKATTLARKMTATYGMTDEVGPVQVLHEGAVFMGRDFGASQHTSGDILNAVDREIRVILDEAQRRALEICRTNRKILDDIVRELLERETMVGPELDPYLSKVKILAPPKSVVGRAGLKGNGASPTRPRQKRATADPPAGIIEVE